MHGNITHIRQEMARLCVVFARNETEVALLAVSKTVPADIVLLAAQAGQHAFGENYVQEGVDKIATLAAQAPDLAAELQWHMIGPLQSNKTKAVAEHFDWVHTIDRLKIAQRLNAQRPPELPPLQVLLQVNIDGAPSKAGLMPQDILPLAVALQELPHIALRGLMAMPDAQDDDAALAALYAQVAQLLQQLQAEPALAHCQLDTLSMGMSGDMAPAIAGGSTLLRIGSAIFGQRQGKSA